MHDVSLYLLELLENSIRAGATQIAVGIRVDRHTDRFRVTVDDDGGGLSVTPDQALDPFFTTKGGKKTGLGLSLFRAEAEAAGGGLTIGPSPLLGGVRVQADMQLSHVDRPPIGDLGTTLTVMELTNRNVSFTVSLSGDGFEPSLERATVGETAEAIARCTQRLERAASEEQGQNVLRPSRPVDTRPGRRKEQEDMTQDGKDRAGGCACCEEPSEEELLARLDEVIENYREKPGALIPVLQIAQGLFGYLPEVALKRIALGLGKPYSEVAGVVGFYSFFSTHPRGRNLVRVCLGTACYVRGGMGVLETLKKELGVDVGETTEDREFSLEVARCFGACGLAPVIMINDDVHHRVKTKRIGEILARYAPEVSEELVAERSA